MPKDVKDLRICFVGDSFVSGVGDLGCLGWTGRICASMYRRGYDFTSYNLGVRQHTSADIEDRWLAEVLCRCPTGCDGRVVFSFGVNDAVQEYNHCRVEMPVSLENARRIFRTAKLRYPILMVGPPAIADPDHNERVRVLSDNLAILSQELEVPYLDTWTPLSHSNIWLNDLKSGDGYHPSSTGYTELAVIVQKWPAWLDWFKRNPST
ncbi:MAG: lipase [Acaryochloris sp. RU_4_1]|nr:lipase [Acaryochloris sp. RU_4_1]NJR56238.1 lipase [Acaryochloris sp. CRU_2_0]